MTDKFIIAITLYASLMGVDKPIVINKSLPGLKAARAVFDGYGWIIERDEKSFTYKTWNKDSLALHEMCHVRMHTAEHNKEFEYCIKVYWKKRNESR